MSFILFYFVLTYILLFTFLCMFLFISQNPIRSVPKASPKQQQPTRRIFLLIIASRSSLYDRLISCYWKPTLEYVEKHYKNSLFIRFLIGNDIQLDLDEPYILRNPHHAETYVPGILQKTLYGIEHVINEMNEDDILIRSNLSSFFIFERLFEYIEKLPHQHVYAGTIERTRNPLHEPHLIKACGSNGFINGACIILSKDVCQTIVKNQTKIDSTLIDDVALRIFLYPYVDMTSIRPSRYVTRPNSTHQTIRNAKSFHIRNIWERFESSSEQKRIDWFKHLVDSFYK